MHTLFDCSMIINSGTIFIFLKDVFCMIDKLQAEKFESLCAEIIEADKAVGMAVAVVDKTGDTLYEKFFGFRDAEKKLPVDGDTIFGLASVSKSFTALSAMQLVERGALDMLRPAREYIPQLNDGRITCQHLVTHSAGFFPFKRVTFPKLAEEMSIDQKTAGDLAFNVPMREEAMLRLLQEMNSQTDFTGRPGENISYSNDSFALLGEIVRIQSGSGSLPEYLDENIFKPLGMGRTTGAMLIKDDNASRLYRDIDGAMEPTDDFLDNSMVMPGGGGLKSTLNDMKKYLYMYLNRGLAPNGTRIVGDYSINEMMRPRQVAGLNQYYGYGLMREAMGALTIIEHGGAMTGVSSNMIFCRENGLGVMVLCNTSGVSVAKVCKAAMRMASGMEPKQEELRQPMPVWDAKRLQAVAGTYNSAEGITVEIAAGDGCLVVDYAGKRLEGLPINDYMFRMKIGTNNIDIRVFDDDGGNVRALGVGLRMVPKAK